MPDSPDDEHLAVVYDPISVLEVEEVEIEAGGCGSVHLCDLHTIPDIQLEMISIVLQVAELGEGEGGGRGRKGGGWRGEGGREGGRKEEGRRGESERERLKKDGEIRENGKRGKCVR